MVWNITRNDSDDGQKYGIPTKRLTGYVQLSLFSASMQND